MRWPKTRTRKRLDAIEQELGFNELDASLPVHGMDTRLDRIEQELRDHDRAIEDPDVDDDIRDLEREVQDLTDRVDGLEGDA